MPAESWKIYHRSPLMKSREGLLGTGSMAPFFSRLSMVFCRSSVLFLVRNCLSVLVRGGNESHSNRTPDLRILDDLHSPRRFCQAWANPARRALTGFSSLPAGTFRRSSLLFRCERLSPLVGWELAAWLLRLEKFWFYWSCWPSWTVFGWSWSYSVHEYATVATPPRKLWWSYRLLPVASNFLYVVTSEKKWYIGLSSEWLLLQILGMVERVDNQLYPASWAYNALSLACFIVIRNKTLTSEWTMEGHLMEYPQDPWKAWHPEWSWCNV